MQPEQFGVVGRLACVAAVLLAAGFAVGTPSHAPAFAQVPVDVLQVDRLLVQVERESRNGDYDAAIATFDRILDIVRDNQWDIPATFWINDAQLAYQAGLHTRAVESATLYLKMAGPRGDYYTQALYLLDAAEDRLQAELEARRRAEEAEARQLAAAAEARRQAEEAEAQRQAQAARVRREEAAWSRIQTSMNAENFDTYVRQFPTSAYRTAARKRAAALRAPGSDENGWTNLHYAAVFDLPDLVHHHAARGANVNADMRRDGAVLTTELRQALRELGHDFGNWTRDGETPLHIAAFVGAARATVALLERGADVNRGTKFDWRPLHYAAWADADDTVEVLIENGARANARTDEVNRPGRTALQIADQSGSRAAAAVLRAYNARR